MQRIAIYSTDDYSDDPVRLGWFDLDAATHVAQEDRKWDGNNMIGVISGLQTTRAQLYRTSGGRWVSHEDRTREFNGPDQWAFLDDEEARNWLMRAEGGEELLEAWFPDTPEESGPEGGRPAVGPQISVAYPKDLLERIDAAAKGEGKSRAAWLRQAAREALR
ncbi:ribbon-helix-helix domain-containing protein [Streptomyces xanthophaeus]|uniref:ribbon-helix-helix domain-containing protein n=1 Tax=Streptomyces xanthophaeus TaxID=67385 RepID=UPI00365FA00C